MVNDRYRPEPVGLLRSGRSNSWRKSAEQRANNCVRAAPTETSAYEEVESWLNSGGDHMSTHFPMDRPVAEPGQQSLGRRIRRFAETVGIALFDFAA